MRDRDQVIDYNVNSFGTGPYRSLDARLARSTIGVCPKDDAASASYQMPEQGAPDDPG